MNRGDKWDLVEEELDFLDSSKNEEMKNVVNDESY